MPEKETKQTKQRHAWNEIVIPAEQLEQMVNQYFQECDKKCKRATKQGLAVFCGISVDTYDRWKKAESKKHKRHSAVLKKAELIMSDRLQQESNAAAIFMLKQPCYGGFSDKQESNDNSHKITIDILSNGQKVN